MRHHPVRFIGFVVPRAIAAVVFVLVAIGLFGFIVMHLWNWLLPPLFGWQLIGFWQAVGLLLLARILFGGIRGRGGWRGHWRSRMRERWEQMTPEEREKFRAGFVRSYGWRCGGEESQKGENPSP